MNGLYPQSKVPAEHFVRSLMANVDNLKLSDEAFRQFVRNTLPIVETEQTTKEDKA